MQFEIRPVKKELAERGLNPEETRRWLTLHERAKFAQMHVRDRRDRPWKVRKYQRESLESFAERKVHCDGRDVGKTAEIELTVMWAAAACPNSEMLVATQTENHLYPLMHRLVCCFETHPCFSSSLIEIKRTPSWHLRFSNGFVLWGRFAGLRGTNFQGMHVDWQIIDEAQEMTEVAWGELFQALNGGGRRWVYGVPNGLRNGFYRMTLMEEAEQYNWPSSLNPDFSAAKDAELVRLYGGKGSPGYIHRVLGQHGSPAHSVFDLENYLACVDEGLEFEDVLLCEGDGFEGPSNVPRGDYYLGCDLGYARDPSEFVVYRVDEPHMANVFRVRLEGVNYSRQRDVIVELDRVFDFQRVVIDAGNNGRAVAHNLMAEGIEWCEKMRAIDFGASIELEALPDGTPDKRPVKQFMTELIEQRLQERSLVFPRLTDRENQYANHVYTVGHNGRIVYEKGNDHIIDADRCAVLSRYLDTRADEVIPIGMRVGIFGQK